MSKKTNQKTKPKSRAKPRDKQDLIFTFGNIDPSRRRILVLIILVIFTMSVMIIMDILPSDRSNQADSAPASQKNIALEIKIAQMVKGYPIARMTPYISQKDPKVAAFLVSIAKKESNWGKRKPVLDGQDCFNYWGFRMQSDKMGSDGHTCFDTPRQAVDTVAARIGEMVNVEKLDSPNEMVVWKCGYGCQNGDKSASELKWIKDVNFYYNKLSDFL